MSKHNIEARTSTKHLKNVTYSKGEVFIDVPIESRRARRALKAQERKNKPIA